MAVPGSSCPMCQSRSSAWNFAPAPERLSPRNTTGEHLQMRHQRAWALVSCSRAGGQLPLGSRRLRAIGRSWVCGQAGVQVLIVVRAVAEAM